MHRSAKKIKALIFLCCLTYFASYLTRYNYAAVLVGLVADLKIDNATGGIAVTGAFIAYGIGQILSGVMGDRFSPVKIVAFGLIATTLVNIAVFFLQSIGAIIAVWCCNGFFQALLWPPIVKLMAEHMPRRAYERATTLISVTAMAANVLIYALSALFLEVATWRAMFLTSALFSGVTVLVWLVGITKNLAAEHGEEASEAMNDATTDNSPTEKKHDPVPMEKRRIATLFLLAGVFPLIFSIVLQGSLRDSIATWMPTLIKEEYRLSPSQSVLLTCIIPVFSTVAILGASFLEKRIKNEAKSSMILFIVATVDLLVLNLFFGKNAAISVVTLAVGSGCMHGINHLLISRVPGHFAATGQTSTVSGVLNACVYAGAAISTYGYAALSQNKGWDATAVCWLIAAFLSVFGCAVAVKKWKNFRTEQDALR
ncbi:MAG: MFS transporter [Clostridia bacterium]|nr:MFS transporter [Clostridia bacterium]